MASNNQKYTDTSTTRHAADRADDLKDLSPKELDESAELKVKGGCTKVNKIE